MYSNTKYFNLKFFLWLLNSLLFNFFMYIIKAQFVKNPKAEFSNYMLINVETLFKLKRKIK